MTRQLHRTLQLTQLAVALAAVGCASSDAKPRTTTDAIESCKAEFSAAKGYDWHDDLGGQFAPADGGSLPPPPSALDQAVADCTAAGQPSSSCDAALVMTRDAAICVAKHHGLATGIAPLRAGLVFHATQLKIVWNAHNTTSDDGQGTASGDTGRVDAITGELLQKGSWGSTP